jgi:ribosomal-protein-alanine N-acetyltransferase
MPQVAWQSSFCMQTIRRYTSADLEQMVELDIVCFAPEFLFDRASMGWFAEARNAATFVAEADESLIGFVIVHMERGRLGSRGYVVTLDVAPEFRRAGLAGSLMQHIEDHAAAEKARHMDLHVAVTNEMAIRFYEGRGYQRLSLEEGFYGAVGMDAYVYRKALQAPPLNDRATP